MQFDYIVPVTYTTEDNLSYVNKALVMFKNCNGFNDPTANCPGWNFNKCPNDDAYCNPYIPGDKFCFQINLDTTKYSGVSAKAINTATGVESECISVDSQSGADENFNTYFNFFVDTTDCSDECFYLELTYTIKQGHGQGTVVATSEPFCLVKCDVETMWITGNYTGYDCDDYYYAPFVGGANDFKLGFRVYGTNESQGFEINETVNNYKKVKSQQSERFLFRTQKTPYYVIRQVARAFNSRSMTIDDIYFNRANKLDKNFEEGKMWILSQNIYNDCTDINFTCDN